MQFNVLEERAAWLKSLKVGDPVHYINDNEKTVFSSVKRIKREYIILEDGSTWDIRDGCRWSAMRNFRRGIMATRESDIRYGLSEEIEEAWRWHRDSDGFERISTEQLRAILDILKEGIQ